MKRVIPDTCQDAYVGQGSIVDRDLGLSESGFMVAQRYIGNRPESRPYTVFLMPLF